MLDWPIFRWLSERAAKSTVEPLLVILIGCGLAPYHEALAMYLIIAACGLASSVQMCIAFERRQVMDMRDAHLEQQAMAERSRQPRAKP